MLLGYNYQFISFSLFCLTFSFEVSEKQLSMIAAEKSKTVQTKEKFCWDKLAKTLNCEGPVIKKAATWRSVS